MNTKGADDNIEDSDDEDDSNGDVVECGSGLVVLGVVDVQPGQHQEEYAGEDLEKSNVIDDKFKTGIFQEKYLEDDAGDNEGEKDSVELVLCSHLCVQGL